MKILTPAEVIRSLLWIREAQEHVNSCAPEFDDPEALATARELQRSIDDEWEALGLLVSHRPRPYSVLRDELGSSNLAIPFQATTGG
jgi:hypothetical protein